VNRDQLVDQFEATNKTKKRAAFKVGDTVKISSKIIEGEKERVQAFTGVVIAKKGVGNSETFTVYRSAYGSCMERVFLLNSPRISEIEVVRVGDVSKSKLYHIRGETGRKAKIKEKIGGLALLEEGLLAEAAAVASSEKQEGEQLEAVENKPLVEESEVIEEKQKKKKDLPPVEPEAKKEGKKKETSSVNKETEIKKEAPLKEEKTGKKKSEKKQ
jgi:large subunit ribosomal protein L19